MLIFHQLDSNSIKIIKISKELKMLLTKFDPFKQLREIEKNLYNQTKNEGVNAFVPVVNTREGEFAYHVDVDLL